MPKNLKRSRSPSPSLISGPSASPNKAKKLKVLSDYTTKSPFPNHPHPTPIDAREVHDLLTKLHRNGKAPRPHPHMPGGNSAETCGSVSNVIDSLIGTILSQNTSNANSSRAKQSLDQEFGRFNWSAIAEAPKERVVEAIKHGGLANKKASVIQNVLKSIHEKHGKYSLQHLAERGKVTDEEVMRELVGYDGVGPKTAGCVLLFCLGRELFAVDTHVFRLSKVLGWVPMNADRVKAQAHLDLRLPGELKYGLHVLLIQHGRACAGCKNSGKGGACPLKSYLQQSKGLKGEEDIEQRVVEASGGDDIPLTDDENLLPEERLIKAEANASSSKQKRARAAKSKGKALKVEDDIDHPSTNSDNLPPEERLIKLEENPSISKQKGTRASKSKGAKGKALKVEDDSSDAIDITSTARRRG